MRFVTKTKQHNDVTDYICVAYDENEIELSNLSNWVWYITKTKKDNDMNDRTCTVYTEKDTELSWLIRPGAVYDENQIR